ncbi:MAG: glycosyltransferase family 2 protein [Candidatus Latescibacterota bacterium]
MIPLEARPPHPRRVCAPDVTVVVVHHRTPRLLEQCLAHLQACPPRARLETLVVDNASPDRQVAPAAARFGQVRFHRNARNLGFAAACNQGLRLGQGRSCLLLNPDVRIDGPAIDGLVELLDRHPEAGVAAPRLTHLDGSLQFSCRRFPSLRAVLLRGLHLRRLAPGAVDRYLMADWDHATYRAVDWVIGACVLVRRAAVEAVGGFDEGFFLYYEDVDLCFRLGQAGWTVLYDPRLTVSHAHRRESAALLPRRQTLEHLRSLVRLFRKHRFPVW